MQEFAANAMTALHLNELTTYVPNLSIWLMYLLAVLGLLCCFFGYKLRNLWFAAVCLLFGCVVGNYLFSKGILDINFSIAAGLLAAALFVFTYRLAPGSARRCICWFAGWGWSSPPPSSPPFWWRCLPFFWIAGSSPSPLRCLAPAPWSICCPDLPCHRERRFPSCPKWLPPIRNTSWCWEFWRYWDSWPSLALAAATR